MKSPPFFVMTGPARTTAANLPCSNGTRRDYTLSEIIAQALRLFDHLATTMRISDFDVTVTEFQIAAEFEKFLQRPLPEDAFRYTMIYKGAFRHTAPSSEPA
jgi:hypothetical protein